MNANTSAALALARYGYPVFALKENSKHEYKKGHALDRTHATTEPLDIVAMFEPDSRLNIGYIVLQGRVIVDADKERGDLERLPPLGSTRIETTLDDGIHAGFILPAHLAHARGEFTWQGIEIKLAGSRMVGAGSRVNGREYGVLDDSPEADAPAWLIEAIEQHLATQESQRRSSQVQSVAPAQDVSDERGRAWAEAGLLNECREVFEAASGSRFHALRRAAFKCGQLTHLIGESLVREQLLAAARHYDSPRKVESLITSALKAGSLKPRYPTQRTEHTTTRRALAEMVRLCDVSAWRGSMEFKTARASGKVRASGVRSVLAAILQRAHAANTLDVSISQRLLAELAHCGKAGAWRTLQALQTARLLSLAKASDGLDSANVYRLTPRGFLSLQRASFCIVVESRTSQLRERPASANVEREASEASLSAGSLVDSTTIQIEAALSLGIFAHRTLGRAAYLVARALARAPLTPQQIGGVTGLAMPTVYRVLKVLEAAQMVERGARGEASRLADNFAEAALDVASEYSTQARSTARKFRHAKERKAWREAIEARQKATQKAPEAIEATPPTKPAAERARERYSVPIEALRYRVRQHNTGAYLQTEATQYVSQR